MFLRKSRSSDALGNAKRSDAQSVRGGDTSKLKQKLNGKRSFRLFKSPKLGMPPEPSPKIVPSPPSQRLGSNGPSGTVHSAQGLGIKHAQGPDAENLSRPSLNYTRPIPHARMYNAQDAMSTSDMFSTSRPPGMGMRLPPSRIESARSAPDFEHMRTADTLSAPHEPMHNQTTTYPAFVKVDALPPSTPAPASEPLPSIPAFPPTEVPLPPPKPSDVYPPQVVHVGPPFVQPAESGTHMATEHQAPDNALASKIRDHPAAQRSWPEYQPEVNYHHNFDTSTSTLDQSVGNISLPVGIAAGGSHLPWTSHNEPIDAPPSSELATAVISPPPQNQELYPDNTRAGTEPNVSSVSETVDAPYSGVGDALVRPYHVSADGSSYRLSTWTMPEQEDSVLSDKPMSGDMKDTLALESASSPNRAKNQQTRTSVRLDNNTIVTAEPSLFDSTSSSQTVPPLDVTKMVSRDSGSFLSQDDVAYGASPVKTAPRASQPPGLLPRVAELQEDQRSLVSPQSVVEPKPEHTIRSTNAQKQLAQHGAPAPLSESVQTSTPVTSQPQLYRVECMLGSHTLVYNDPVLQGMPPKPVAYTYDNWYLEPVPPPTSVQRGPSISAIVAKSPPAQQAYAVPLCLGVFTSHLEHMEEGGYVLDVAVPMELEGPPHVAPSQEPRPVSLSLCLRNAALFSMSSHLVIAATPHRLVAEMTSGSSPGLMQDILLGYRQCFNARRLLDLLLLRMEWAIQKLDDPHIVSTALRVLTYSQSALWHWLRHYYQDDFQNDEALTRRLVQWTADQYARCQFWQIAKAVDAPEKPLVAPHLPVPPITARHAHNEELPATEPQERMQVIYSLVQALVPASLLPPREEKGDEKKESFFLRKSRSLSRMLSNTQSSPRSRRGHSRKFSGMSGTSAGGAGQTPSMRTGSGAWPVPMTSATAVPPPTPPRRVSDEANTSGIGANADGGISTDTSTDMPETKSQIGRSRSMRSLRRMLQRNGASGVSGSDTCNINSFESPPDEDSRGSVRKYEKLVPDEDGDVDMDGDEHDTALQQLEQALSDTPRAEELHSARVREGPFQWIPRHNTSTWKEAQRMSMMTAKEIQPHVPQQARGSVEPAVAPRDSFLLCQRSSTIARQLSGVEREIMSNVKWTELSEAFWDQHTVRQEQWQLEYQEFVALRVREAMGEKEESSRRKCFDGKGIHMLIARFNRTCAWVASHIVKATNLSERVAIVNKFIRIAWHCYRQGNMESLCQIMFGLQSPWVARLQQTWDRVAMWELRAFEALRRFTSPRDQFAFLRYSMREAVESNVPMRRFSKISTPSKPYIPFFGLFVSDLSTIDSLASFVDAAGMPNMMPLYDDQELSQSWDALVNVYRMRMKACIVREFITLQQYQRHATSYPVELPILVEMLQLDTLSAMAIQRYALHESLCYTANHLAARHSHWSPECIPSCMQLHAISLLCAHVVLEWHIEMEGSALSVQVERRAPRKEEESVSSVIYHAFYYCVYCT